jgi:dihydrodipicolinate synthase/N-acetylneuraminate lyase
MSMNWNGVIPAITTPFKEDYSVDLDFLGRHVEWLLASGCTGIVALGSLGEGATLTFEEKHQVLSACRARIGTGAGLVAGVSSLSTAEAVAIAKTAEDAGCDGLMVLPPYVYLGDWRETKAHVGAILSATPLSCMLYNNPIAYKVDFLPQQVQELVNEFPNLHAIKESSADVRRVTALRVLIGDRLRVLSGVDDAIVEAVGAGAVGWIAGLVNAFPKESVDLFDRARAGDFQRAFEIYRWFLPLLRMDTVPKFVQLIKLAQEEVGMGSRRVRGPRLELAGEELAEGLRVIRNSLTARPSVASTAA